MNTRKMIAMLFILIWICLIFILSEQDSKKSLKTSDNVLVKIVEVYKGRKLSNEEKKDTKKRFTVYIRKSAHFFLYFVLAILVFMFLKEVFKDDSKMLIFTIIICLIFAIIDECHQLYIPGRCGRILDVIIDTCGSVFSTFIICVCLRIKWKVNKKERI